MADYTVKDVTTFVAELPAPPLQVILNEKFRGRRTTKTLEAARRIAKKKRTVKVPANLLKQLFLITGGWQNGALKAGWTSWDGEQSSKSVRIGDLTVYLREERNSSNWYFTSYLKYRGLRVACIGYYANNNASRWLDNDKAAQSLRAMAA